LKFFFTKAIFLHILGSNQVQQKMHTQVQNNALKRTNAETENYPPLLPNSPFEEHTLNLQTQKLSTILTKKSKNQGGG
jgi:hypothetical protein